MHEDNGGMDDVGRASLEKATTTVVGVRDLALRVIERLQDAADATVDRVQALAGYPTIDRQAHGSLTRTVGVWALNVWFVEDRRPTPDEASVLTDLAQTRAAQGVPLDAALVALQIAVTETWRLSLEIAHEMQAPPDVLLAFAQRIADFQRFTTTTILGVYRGLEREAASRLESKRSDFLRGLVQGTLRSHMLAAEAAAHGLRVDLPYVAIRARSQNDGALESLVRTLRDPAPDRNPALVGYLDGDLVGVVDPRTVIEAPDATVGVGRPAVLAAISDSFRLAGRVLAAATAFGLTGMYGVEDVGLLPAVVADTEISDWLVERRLAPLLTVQRFGESLIDTLRSFLDNGMRVDATAQQLMLHPNTLRHRLRRIEELTGVDLAITERLFEIWWALRALEAREAQRPEPTVGKQPSDRQATS